LKELNPRTPSKNPKGWIRVFDAFREFRNVAGQTGEKTAGWALLYPDKFSEKFTRGWEIIYSIGGYHQTVFVGHDPQTAVLGIQEMIKTYPKHKREPERPTTPPTPKSYDPKYDPNYIRKMFNEWQQVIKKVGHSISPATYERDYVPRFRLLSVRAGVLNISMREYLTNHPHAQYWPVPPTSEAELRRRTTEFERIVQQKESRRRHEDSNGFR